MGTNYTEDPVGKAVEEHYIGTHGIATGSVANSIGLSEYERRQRAGTTTGVPVRRRGGGGKSYEMLPMFQGFLDAIPRWLYLLLGGAGAVAGYALLGAEIGGEAGPYVAAGIGALVGWVILPLTVGLIDLAIQLTWALIKIAVVLGIIGGVIWALSRMAG